MDILLTLITGFIVSVMIFFNGELSAQAGIYTAAVIIHIAGVFSAWMLCRLRNQKIRKISGLPLYLYLGGAFGVLTTLFANMAFSKISMTSIIALELLGQTCASLGVDATGWMGMQKSQLTKAVVPGLVLSFLGIFFMLDFSSGGSFFPVLMAFLAGACVVLSRTINGKLASHTGELQSSFFNHLVGLPLTLILALALQSSTLLKIFSASGIRPWIFLGGLCGAVTVYLYNILVPKVSALQLTLLTFIGQVFTGILLDIFVRNTFDQATFIGGIIISAGILLNTLLEQWAGKKRRS